VSLYFNSLLIYIVFCASNYETFFCASNYETTPTFPNVATPTTWHKGNEIWFVKLNENRGAQQEISYNKNFKRNCTVSTGVPNLGVWRKKWSKWTSGVRSGQNIRLRLPVLLGIRLRLDSKTSDSLRLWIWLRNPANKFQKFQNCSWKICNLHFIFGLWKMFKQINCRSWKSSSTI